MKILIFGATGQTGILLLQQALEKGHHVTVFVRNPDKIELIHQGLRVIKGEIKNAKAVADAVQDQEVIYNCLGVRYGEKEQVCTESTGHILAGMEKHQVKRLIVIGGAASGKTLERSNGFVKWIARLYTRFGDGFAVMDKDNQYKLLLNSNKDYTVVSAPWLTNGRLSRKYRHGQDLPISLFHKISRADLAHFMLSTGEKNQYIRQEPYICY